MCPIFASLSSHFPCICSDSKRARRAAPIASLFACVSLLLSACGAKPGANSTPPPFQDVAITEQPASASVPLGSAGTFSVTATGTAPLSYQWSENGVEIPGATSASYTTRAVTVADSGSSLQVVVSNASSSQTSSTATLTVGPRSPMAGDLRFQEVDTPFPNLEVEDGAVSDLVTGFESSYPNATGSPLMIGYGVCYPGSEYDCAWQYATNDLPSGMTGLTVYYESDAYQSFASDLQSISASNIVVTCLDFQPANNAYGASWLQTAKGGGFDYRLEVASPAQIQATATADAAESRVVTALSFDASGNANLLSYGWTGDTTTAYEAQAFLSTGDNVGATATTLASQGYILTAFGGNDVDGYVLIGTRVKGDSLPRPIIVVTPSSPSTGSELNGYAPVARVGTLDVGGIGVFEH